MASTTLKTLLLAACLAACADVGLQPTPPPPPETFDNRLTIRGQHCVQPDEQLDFPVKVLLAVDQSASFQCTDSSNRRFDELRGVVDGLLGQPSVSVGLVGFASWARSVPFTTNRGEIDDLLLDAGGSATDYQGSLALISQTLENDMIATPPGERARTRYVIVFVSDGSPEPRCRAGCEDGASFGGGAPGGGAFVGTCANGEDDDGDGLIDAADPDCQDPDELDRPFSPCNLQGRSDFPDAVGDDEYVDFSGVCPDYNQPPQILQRVEDILDLEEVYGVGSVQLNTVLIFSPQPVVEGACPGASMNFGLDRVDASVIMQQMAERGRGLFRDVDISTEPRDFLSFDFRPLSAPNRLSGLLADNVHAGPGPGGIEPDTDRDGLTDREEIVLGTDTELRDSDPRIAGGLPNRGDGYGDGVEARLRSRGYDPMDQLAPPVRCEDAGEPGDDPLSDEDGDGLLFCEEDALGSSPILGDTDGDQMPDFLEATLGTDPAVADADEDTDFDGIPNGAEIIAGTDPLRPDAERYRLERITYDVTDLGPRDIEGDERRCYDFEARNLQMVETPVVGERGLNRFLIYAQEQPSMLSGADGQTYVACFEAFFNGETAKVPESGIIDASQEGWTALLSSIQTGVDRLGVTCPQWFPEGFGRNQLLRNARECLPETVVLGGFAYDATRVEELVRTYIAGNLGQQLDLDAHDLFVRLAAFDPDRDCVRPWEIDRLLELFVQFDDACACRPPASEDDPPLSPCCEVTE
ncbi:MAG: VWA domain-containing protein [Myxococcota bacterium]